MVLGTPECFQLMISKIFHLKSCKKRLGFPIVVDLSFNLFISIFLSSNSLTVAGTPSQNLRNQSRSLPNLNRIVALRRKKTKRKVIVAIRSRKIPQNLERTRALAIRKIKDLIARKNQNPRSPVQANLKIQTVPQLLNQPKQLKTTCRLLKISKLSNCKKLLYLLEVYGS